jgi:hypothetical protein
MADIPGIASTIRCQSCGFENTTTSLYCQDCGVRLVAPPSAIAAENAASPANTPPIKPAAKKPRILSKKRAAKSSSPLTIVLRTLIVAAIAALIIQILRPPTDLPAPSAPLPDNIVANVRAALQASAQRNSPFDAPWAGQGLNAYLAAVLRPGDPSGVLKISFQRASLSPITGGFSLFVERKVLGLSIYSRIDYQLVTRGNGIGVEPIGAALGQLPLPAFAAPMIESMNGNLGDALSSELTVLREAKSIRITAQKASLDFGAAPRP